MKAMLKQKFLRMPMWFWITLGIFVLGGLIAFQVSKPQHASWRYGACKAILEQYVRFPTSLKIRQGGETRGSAIISFADINPFGAQQIRIFECHFSNDAQGRVNLTRITLDRKALPDDVVKKFAEQLPILSSQELDTALPKDLPTELEDLKED